MIRQTPGKMYLADQRGLTESGRFRRYSTFNFDSYQQEFKEPFGRLRALNEETLAGGHRLELTAAGASQVLIVPITGAVGVAGGGVVATVQVEEVQLLQLPAQSTVCFTNLYETELISFLHVWLTAHPTPAGQQLFSFDFSFLKNKLVEIVAPEAAGFSLSLGQFGGRQEAFYTLKSTGSHFFAFVLAGAFEVEGRLLHEKDGLALWDVEQVELEALSNDALVLVLEF
ncbi:pirin [Hymenobacter lucidus]|uniref:Pirin n=1 Tax=Hymenobacter lucidus TaxID=2880930 RepID=A0ABS8ARM3_9BACT|nr:pirin [Hymenobacter lucidus]MCB2408054.1 pirin [Hymenobacter lucidus]